MWNTGRCQARSRGAAIQMLDEEAKEYVITPDSGKSHGPPGQTSAVDGKALNVEHIAVAPALVFKSYQGCQGSGIQYLRNTVTDANP